MLVVRAELRQLSGITLSYNIIWYRFNHFCQASGFQHWVRHRGNSMLMGGIRWVVSRPGFELWISTCEI